MLGTFKNSKSKLCPQCGLEVNDFLSRCPTCHFEWSDFVSNEKQPELTPNRGFSPRMKKLMVLDALFLFCWPIAPVITIFLASRHDGIGAPGFFLFCVAITIPLFIAITIYSLLSRNQDCRPKYYCIFSHIIKIISIASYIIFLTYRV